MTEKRFLTTYEYAGETWASDLYAESWEQAEEKLKAKRETEKIEGYVPNEDEE